MHSIANIKNDLTNLTTLSIVVVNEENIFTIDIILGEIVDFSVEKILVAQITTRQVLNEVLKKYQIITIVKNLHKYWRQITVKFSGAVSSSLVTASKEHDFFSKVRKVQMKHT